MPSTAEGGPAPDAAPPDPSVGAGGPTPAALVPEPARAGPLSEGSGRRRWVPVLLALAGVALLVAATVLVLDREPAVTARPVGVVPARTAPSVPTDSGDLRPGAPPKLRPGGTVPVRLDLPARAGTAPVVPVGTGPDGALVIPDPPRTVGWWAPGALAGSGTGTVVVAGHVDSRVAGIGVLAVLPELTVGEPVVLTGDDGRTVRYRVVARREFGKAALPADTFARTGPPRLVLMTCGGRFDRHARSYEDNIVVYAEPA
ncbi:class F sortase [Pseudonocardia sp. RS11V-5]|uniref:class F sortase n=1 Tax=Pseudonocardia terrae TaxID=2905831 RepID=UPI001E28EE5A|nr:class F sortase [Pseudonocardia terrae]MCE3550726.1 class F sortase [Pseudonocardia terrae]